MSGRRLYDKHCDAILATKGSRWSTVRGAWEDDYAYDSSPKAWPFLTRVQQRYWNDLAKRVTPRARRS